MTRLEFIFSAANSIANKKHGRRIEFLLAKAVLHEIEIAKRELRSKAAAAGSGGDRAPS